MLQGKVSKWQDLGSRSCGLIQVGRNIYSVNASEVPSDETGKRELILGEVVVFEPMPDRVESGKVYRAARKVIRPADLKKLKERTTENAHKQREARFEAERQKERAAFRQRCLRRRLTFAGGYLKTILQDGECVVYGCDDAELLKRESYWIYEIKRMVR
jgi:hypothetical protein